MFMGLSSMMRMRGSDTVERRRRFFTALVYDSIGKDGEENAAAAGRRLVTDRAALSLGQALGQREAKPRADRRAGAATFDLTELLKQTGHIGFRHTDTVVFNLHA